MATQTETAMEDMDIQHKAFFSFDPTSFLGDLSNIAMDVCADGFDDFERNIHASEQLSNSTKAALSQVIYQMYCITLESLNRAASNFERYEQLTSLAVPPELYMQQPLPAQVSEPADLQQEQQLDQELEQLRQQVTQARLKFRQLQQRIKLLDKDLSRAASCSAAYKPLMDAMDASAQPVLEEAAAISQLAAKLRPMLARARQLQLQHHHQHRDQQQPEQQQLPLATRLLAAAVGVHEEVPDDEGAASSSAAEPGTNLQHDLRQMMASATLQQLQAVNADLQEAA